MNLSQYPAQVKVLLPVKIYTFPIYNCSIIIHLTFKNGWQVATTHIRCLSHSVARYGTHQSMATIHPHRPDGKQEAYNSHRSLNGDGEKKKKKIQTYWASCFLPPATIHILSYFHSAGIFCNGWMGRKGGGSRTGTFCH